EKVVRLLERAVSDVRRVEYSGMPAWTDAANLIEKGIPSVVFGAGELSLAHTERENIAVDDLLDLCRILKRFIELSGMESGQLP
ncbi:MAG: M20/M25/M40 family metallo-hydrolase, partial [Thermoplasmata archaeon]|nr:M20/M25/M40 family metallo-hydrolase [Thermoplasmata archaeon]